MFEKASTRLGSSEGLLCSVFHVDGVCKFAHNLSAEMDS